MMDLQQRRCLETNGFVHVEGVLAPGDLEAVRAEYRQLLQTQVTCWVAAGRLPGSCDLSDAADLAFEEQLLALAHRPGFDAALLAELDITLPHMPFSVIRADAHCHVGDGVLSLLTNPAVLDVIEPVVGDHIVASPNQHCRLKLPTPSDDKDDQRFVARPGETMYASTIWHQDAMTQMPQSDDTPIVTCWIPLVDVDVHNGCLLVAPGEHRPGRLLPWPMDPATVDRLQAAAVPVPARVGDIVLLHKRAPHASLPNHSGRVRWSFDFRYLPAGAPTDRPWFPSIQVRPRPAGLNGDAWCHLWDQARDLLVASGQPLPGRREFAEMMAQAHMRRWDDGDYPVFVSDSTSPAAAHD